MGIDWNKIHRRLAAAAEALEGGVAVSPGQSRNILKARAQALAEEPEDENAAGESIDILEFKLAFENYGLESAFVREVYPLKAFTPLPGAPSFVLGITNVRGQVLAVIDLKKFFELPDKGLSDLNKVVIVRDTDRELGILADAIIGIRSIRLDQLQPSLPTLTGIRQDYLKGVTRERVVVLDAGKLLSDKALIVPETAGA